MPTKAEYWIGLAQFRRVPSSGVLMDANEGYANCVGLAESEAAFARAVRRRAARLGLNLVELEEVELLEARWTATPRTAEAVELRQRAEAVGDVAIGPLHTWTSDDQ